MNYAIIPRARITAYTGVLYDADHYVFNMNYECVFFIVEKWPELCDQLCSSSDGFFRLGPFHACEETWYHITRIITYLLEIPSIKINFFVERENSYEDYDNDDMWGHIIETDNDYQ